MPAATTPSQSAPRTPQIDLAITPDRLRLFIECARSAAGELEYAAHIGPKVLTSEDEKAHNKECTEPAYNALARLVGVLGKFRTIPDRLREGRFDDAKIEFLSIWLENLHRIARRLCLSLQWKVNESDQGIMLRPDLRVERTIGIGTRLSGSGALIGELGTIATSLESVFLSEAPSIRVSREPTQDAFKAYWASTLAGSTQKTISLEMKISQSKVSRMLKKVQKWIAAGGEVPSLSKLDSPAPRSISVDPALIDKDVFPQKKRR